MVIYKVIDIEELKCIKRSMHRNQAINEIGILGCRHKMDSSIYTIKMNDCKMMLSIVSIDIQLYQPEACVLMRFHAHKRKPLHKSTRVLFVLMLKGEEEKNASYFKPTCSINTWIRVDKNTVIVCRAFSPWSGCSDVLPMHASDPADITQGMKCCNSWVEYVNLVFNQG